MPTAFVLDIETEARHAEALAERLRAAWERPLAVLERPACPRVWIQLFFDDEPAMQRVAAEVRRWRGVRAAQPRTLRPRDWAESWRRHFRAQRIGRRLLLVPEGDPTRVRGRLRIVIHPGLSFGTGEHFTTRFCLESLDRLAATRGFAQSMLDLGTGSGVLAIAASKLGCPHVLGVDHDPLALESARANLRLNRLASRVRLQTLDLNEQPIPGPFDLVCANIYSGLLLACREALSNTARRWMALSGIRDTELDTVGDAYRDDTWREIARDSDGEWGGLLFERTGLKARRCRS